jgi:chromosome condensin MukBEF ATPase and DNA-binding subunit MukB
MNGNRFGIEAAILVNWLGYPFQTLPIQDLVLQMHGRNGAGKTTCMLAMVAPLVPDPRRLNKTVQITHNGTGSGLRGVVALDGAPGYAVLVLRRGGEVLYVGAIFSQSTKNSAGVEATAFVILGLPADTKASDWLLGKDGTILPITGVDKAVLALGGRLRKADSLKAYYQDLYDLQLLPRPFTAPEDQKLYANTLLNAFNKDPAEIIDALDDYLLREEDRLAEFVETVDGTFRDIVRVREQVGRYEEQEGALTTLWEGADGVLRRAWAWDFLNQRRTGARVTELEAEERSLQAQLVAERSKAAAAEEDAQRLFREGATLCRTRYELTDKASGRATELERLADRAELILEACRRRSDFEARDKKGGRLVDADDARQRSEAFQYTYSGLQTVISELEKQIKGLEEDAAELETGTVPADVQQLADTLGGTVLASASRFDRLSIEKAALVEAGFGPRRYAIMVKDPVAAAKTLVKKKGDLSREIWLCGTDGEDEAIAETLCTGEGVAAFSEGSFVRVTGLPNAPALGAIHRKRLAKQKREEATTIRKTVQAQRDTAKVAQDLMLAAYWLADNWHLVVADLPPFTPSVLRLTAKGLQIIVNREGRAGPNPEVEKMPPEDRNLALSLISVKDKYEDNRRHLAAAERIKDASTRNATGIAPQLAKAQEAVVAAREAQTKAAQRIDAWVEITKGEECLSWMAERDERYALVFGTDFESGGLQGAIARLAAQTMAAGQTNSIIRGTAERLGIDMRVHFGSLGGSETTPHTARDVLRAWQEARRICFSFMPHDVSQSDDPMLARGEIQKKIRSLKEELLQAEGVYRDRCAGMLTTINASISTHQRRIDRLNGDHTDIRFGDFTGIQLRLERNNEMLEQFKAVTTRAKEITAKSEAALEDVIEQARRDLKARGQKITLPPTVEEMLDYRKYVRLKVMVRRRSAPDKWVPLEDSGASTGERMGLGFMSLLMINASWEATDLELRPRAANTSLRFIVVDEVSRLDETSLETMVTFAERSATHIVMAAPQEVPVQGRCRIYTLARLDTENGRRTKVSRVLPHARAKRPGGDVRSHVH